MKIKAIFDPNDLALLLIILYETDGRWLNPLIMTCYLLLACFFLLPSVLAWLFKITFSTGN